MGLAIDSVLVEKNNPGAAFAAMAVVAGNNDSLTVRSFPETSNAYLEAIIRRHNTSGGIRITSPLMHDNVTGLTFFTQETPSILLQPPMSQQRVYRGDTLSVAITGDTTHDSVAVLRFYYENLDGASARLYSWPDIAGNIKSLKGLEVDVTASGTVGLWSDTALNATDKQLHSDSQYAVLGYITDTALAAVGIKGQSTGNLRVVGPGTINPEDTSYYFVNESNYHGTPHIPVFNGIDQATVFCSVADNAASTTAKISLVLAELMRPLA